MSKADWEKGLSTRSGLLWEVERILKELPKEELPDVLLMENVPQVHSEQNANDFMSWQDCLNSLGYFNFIKDLNAKDYGIPQNRERCFMVSILSNDFISYEFPKPIKLEKVMKDFLEDEVDEKYYIQTEKADKLINDLLAETNIGGGWQGRQTFRAKEMGTSGYTPKGYFADVAATLMAIDWKGPANFADMNGVLEL